MMKFQAYKYENKAVYNYTIFRKVMLKILHNIIDKSTFLRVNT